MGKEKDTKINHTVYNIEDVGQVQIADEVVAVIAGLAATEVEGVAKTVSYTHLDVYKRQGLTELVLTLLHSRKVLIRQQLFMMPARQQSQDMQMFFYAILPDVFIIRRTL